MHIPSMPSITKLPGEKLRKPEVAFRVFEENLGEMKNPDKDGNCRYYVIFEAFNFLGNDLALINLLYCLEYDMLK